MIIIAHTPDKRVHYAFDIRLISSLASLDELERYERINEVVTTWVAENEGRNSVEFDCIVNRIADELTYQVHEYETLPPFNG